jgi:hypothetical protein
MKYQSFTSYYNSWILITNINLVSASTILLNNLSNQIEHMNDLLKVKTTAYLEIDFGHTMPLFVPNGKNI